ncbi:MAG: hypothetical protein ACO28P_00195, partial [Ilumatobacteraceae bacterium]
MGEALAPRRLQVGRETLTPAPLVARVVPDVTGIDRQFDYLVPPQLVGRARPGAIVRIDLNGRRVDGWIVATGDAGTAGFDGFPAEKLSPLVDIAGLGVAEDVVDLCAWVAQYWAGPLRNVLRSASPDRKRARAAQPRHGRPSPVDDDVSSAFRALPSRGGV